MASPRRVLLPAAVATVATLALTGCSGGLLELRAGTAQHDSSARISVSPAPTGKAVAPATPVVVSVRAGRLTDVVVSGPGGPVPGSLSPDGLTWTSTGGTLDYASQYSVHATAVDRTGLPTGLRETIRTVAPSAFLGLVRHAARGRHGRRGDAHPGRSRPPDQRTRRPGTAVEKRLVVTADGRPVLGGWRWQTDDVLVYRPAAYWPGGATVAVAANLKGVRLGPGLWGRHDVTSTFRTGPAMVSYVDMRTHLMRVTRDGTEIRTIPITTGKTGFETRIGTKVVMSKERTRIMDAATGGTLPTDPEYYRLEVEYAMRLTNSGEFLHAAPWSVRHQGHENVSHGCTGMSTADAAWLYANTLVGDVVVYTGGTRTLEPGNGITVWNVSWQRWKRYSALA